MTNYPLSAKFKPMRARDAVIDKIQYPVAMQPKLDGERLCVLTGESFSRSMKHIGNQWLRNEIAKIFQDAEYQHADGEIQVGGKFTTTTGMLTSNNRDGEDFIYHVFDLPISGLTFAERHAYLVKFVGTLDDSRIQVVPYTVIHDEIALLAQHKIYDADPRLDGSIIRNLDSMYKHGKGTISKQETLRIKSWQDSEAEIIGFEERMKNNNEAQTNELGRTFRSSAKAGKAPTGMIAKYLVKWRGNEFKVTVSGSMEDDPETGEKGRKWRWDNKAQYLGKFVKFRYQGLTVNGVPRFATELGLRDPITMVEE